jgi:hypothetical protein
MYYYCPIKTYIYIYITYIRSKHESFYFPVAVTTVTADFINLTYYVAL